MTALAANFSRSRVGNDVMNPLRKSMGVAASTRIYLGALVALNLSGYLVPASADPTLYVVGVAEEEKDNSSGSAGALTTVPRRGTFPFANSSSAAAVSATDVGRVCYAVDDTTVSRTNPIGSYPVAGVVAGLDADGNVLVEVGHGRAALERADDLLIVAGADLSTTGQNRFVALDSAGAVVLAATAGMVATGVLLNAPASGAVAIVRRRGLCRMLFEEAVTEGVCVAVAVTTGRAKIAVNASANTGTGVITGSFLMAQALEESSGAGDLALVDVQPMGCRPGTLA